jgi:hypothetical protein
MGQGSSVRIRRVFRFALPLVILSVLGWGAAGSAALPLPEELVPNTVARVSDVSERAGTVTLAEFRHALVLAAAGEDRAVPKPGGRGYEKLMRTAVDTLLEAVWIKGQAAEMNIVVTRRQVWRELAFIKKENFKNGAEYRQFLKEAHFTRRDVFERVELQLLSTRIQIRVAAGARNPSDAEKAFTEFVSEYIERWRSRTVCAVGYVTDSCSNGPEPR